MVVYPSIESVSEFSETNKSTNNIISESNPKLEITDETKEENTENSENNACCSAYRQFLSDWRSISILLFLYTLQGLPLGLIGSIPLIIQEKNVTYNEQAKFSLAGWPFSLKLLWAPLVDALYFKRLGRRKSWLIPVQYLIGFTLLFLSYQVDDLIDALDVGTLTFYFFLLNFLTATQDVAVDGWCLTMLKRENVGLASTCNAVGQAFGAFIGYALFLNLASADFANNYLRSEPKPEGIVTLSSFMFMWSSVYFVSTTLILIFKSEEDNSHLVDESEGKNTILTSYTRLWHITKLPAVRLCMLFFFTRTLGFAAVGALSDLKFVEAGIAKEVRALMSVPLTPISLLVPLIISRWTAGFKPMSVYMKAYCVGMAFTGVMAIMVWVTTQVKNTDGSFPSWYIPTLILVECLFRVLTTTMFVANMAFVARISDPAHGATFMTLYNTLSNLGSAWPTAIALWLVDPLTIKSCDDKNNCAKFDGYYMETIGCIVIGYVWFFWGARVVKKLQKLPESEWRLSKNN